MYSYRTVTEITDNGPYITKLILHTPVQVRKESVDEKTFSVYVRRSDPKTGETILTSREWMGPRIYPSEGYRSVTAAYPCTEDGRPVYQSDFIALEMPYGPLYPLGQTIAPYEGMFNMFVTCSYRVTQIREIPDEVPVAGLVFDEPAGDICPQAGGWAEGVSHYAPMPLKYGYFTPDREQAQKMLDMASGGYAGIYGKLPEKLPLVIWLHGMGEGGQDPALAYTGNKVVAISGDKIQRKLGGAAYVLAPQAPSFWMDAGTPDPMDQEAFVGPESRYTEPLKALIDEFLEDHPDIDRDRVYIGGCSNGGFMTMRMVLSYPGFFAAAYPVCAAFRDSDISDADLENLKKLPLWFVQAENDPIVPPDILVVPLYDRLTKAGADNVHVTLRERIRDTSGLFCDEQGKPYEYIGHFSWIPVFNDEIVQDLTGRVFAEGRPVTLWSWLGKQRKK